MQKIESQNQKIQYIKEKFKINHDSEENDDDDHKILYNQFHMIENKHFQLQISKQEK